MCGHGKAPGGRSFRRGFLTSGACCYAASATGSVMPVMPMRFCAVVG